MVTRLKKKGGEIMKKKVIVTLCLILLLITVAGVAIAAFGDKGEVLGSSFTVGSADIKLLDNLAGGTSSDNLVTIENI